MKVALPFLLFAALCTTLYFVSWAYLVKQGTPSPDERLLPNYDSRSWKIIPSAENITTPKEEKQVFLGFIRVPKAASNSMLAFLHYASGWKSYNNFLYKTKSFLDSVDETAHGNRDFPFCVFGHDASTNRTFDPTSGENPFGLNNAHPKHHQKFCPYLNPTNIKEYWDESTRYLARKERHHVVLQPFTMIREPFDRWLSIYHSAKDGCGTKSSYFKASFNTKQYKHICDGDFAGMMKQLYRYNGGTVIDMPNQYNIYFNQQVNEAIRFMEGESPSLLVLLSECFEESILLLEKKYNFRRGAAKEFVKSQYYRENESQTRKEKHNATELAMIRADTEYWFAEEYKFYDAAVEHFQFLLLSVDLDPSEVETSCRHWTRQEKQRIKDMVAGNEMKKRRCVLCNSEQK